MREIEDVRTGRSARGLARAYCTNSKKRQDNGATDEQLAPALEFQRRAQWRLDFVAAENSMGFHAPQETARILAAAADLAWQGQIAELQAK